MLPEEENEIEGKNDPLTQDGGEAPPGTGWHLYILECAGGRLYTGIARDVEARFRAHRAGRGAKFTRSYPPERVVFVKPLATRSEALKEEHAVKKLSASAKREMIRSALAEAPLTISSEG